MDGELEKVSYGGSVEGVWGIDLGEGIKRE